MTNLGYDAQLPPRQRQADILYALIDLLPGHTMDVLLQDMTNWGTAFDWWISDEENIGRLIEHLQRSIANERNATRP